MTDKEYHNILEFRITGNALIPVNQNAMQYVEQNHGVVALKDITKRDVRFHRAYFKLLNFIYSWLPDNFKSAVSSGNFYQWLKHLKGQYEILYEFKDGSKFIEYESISFGRMNDARFKEYVKEQLPVIYEDVFLPLLGDDAPIAWQTVESEFENYLNTLL